MLRAGGVPVGTSLLVPIESRVLVLEPWVKSNTPDMYITAYTAGVAHSVHVLWRRWALSHTPLGSTVFSGSKEPESSWRKTLTDRALA